MKPKSFTALPLWLLPVVGLGFGLAVSAIGLVPLWLTTSSKPQPAATVPPVPPPVIETPAPVPAPTSALKAPYQLTSSEQAWVAGAMAGAACHLKRGTATQEVARMSYRTAVLSKGIDPDAAYNDQTLMGLSKDYFRVHCQ